MFCQYSLSKLCTIPQYYNFILDGQGSGKGMANPALDDTAFRFTFAREYKALLAGRYQVLQFFLSALQSAR